MGIRIPGTLFVCLRQFKKSNGTGQFHRTRLDFSNTWGQSIRSIHQSSSNDGTNSNHGSTIISTLKRENLQSCDFIGTSRKQPPVIRIQKFKADGSPSRRVLCKLKPYPKFPIDGGGFLYFHIPPGCPPISGELRFRVTPSSDPKSFDQGYDMTMPNGFYWRIQLPAMSTHLRNLAVRDWLIPPNVAEECEQYLSKPGHLWRKPILHYLEQPFPLNFQSRTLALRLAGDGKLWDMSIHNPVRDLRVACYPAPYRGNAVVRFEKSTLPQHAGTNRVVIRVLKLLQPVELVNPEYDEYIQQPEENSLLSIHDTTSGLRPRSIDPWRNEIGSVGLNIFFPGEHDLRRRNNRVISSLDPDHIEASDALHLVEAQRQLFLLIQNDTLRQIPLRIPRLPEDHPNRRDRNSYGFLYYYKPYDLPETAGEIRLRLTPSQDPSSFVRGKDLAEADGSTWNVSLLRLASETHFEPLIQRLIQDQLVTPSLVTHCQKLMEASRSIVEYPISTPFVHTLQQPFILNFSREFFRIFIVGKSKIGKVIIKRPIHIDENGNRLQSKAWVRFEKSSYTSDSGQPMFVLRLLEPIENNESSLSSLPNRHFIQSFKDGPLVSQVNNLGETTVYRLQATRRTALLLLLSDDFT